jgi:transcriptional regulator with XRE-family HTH domain
MFGERFAAERRRLKMTQQAVAEVLGLGRTAVAMIESGAGSLNADRLVQLGAHGFDVLKVLTGEPSQVAAGQLLNWKLAVEISSGVDEWAHSRGISLPAEKKALILKHLYARFATRGDVDVATLGEMLQVAA